MKNGIIAGAIVAAAFLGGTFLLQQRSSSDAPRPSGDAAPARAVVHKTPTCGCCSNYITYLKRKGFEVEVQNHDDLASIKAQYGIPSGVESCHTTVIGDYAFEGHIPVENITSVLAEKQDIAGLALPGMPAGSPGMGGVAGSFSVYQFTRGGDVSRYAE